MLSVYLYASEKCERKGQESDPEALQPCEPRLRAEPGPSCSSLSAQDLAPPPGPELVALSVEGVSVARRGAVLPCAFSH